MFEITVLSVTSVYKY